LASGILDFDSRGVDVNPGDSQGRLAQLQYGWELDLFGKIKRQTEAAEGDYEATIEGWRDALVFVTSEVAISYIAYRTLERRIEVAVEGRQNFLAIKNKIQGRLEVGVASRLEMEESTARFKTSEALIPQLTQEKIVVRNRLAQLLAIDPGQMQRILSKKQAIPSPPKSIATGFPVDLLRSRPDIRRAERQMAAQVARIGVAEANLYPELSISGALTYEFLRQGITTTILDRVLGIGANLRWRLLNGCANCHRIKENEALLDQAIGVYQQVILQAIADVENSMARIHYNKRRLAILEEASAAHKKTVELMNEAYLAGEVDLQRLLNAQQDYLTTLDEQYATEGRRSADAVSLFKALGGGELAGVPDQKH